MENQLYYGDNLEVMQNHIQEILDGKRANFPNVSALTNSAQRKTNNHQETLNFDN
ncbi:MAG: hypothetical protein LBR36_02545 [Bacteroidales bacterium]|jgi:hypothetical protein|nr:hypothetical protein [Bacteroidales bacterium]